MDKLLFTHDFGQTPLSKICAKSLIKATGIITCYKT